MSPCCVHDKNCLERIVGLLDSGAISFEGVYMWCKLCRVLDLIKITYFANCFDIPDCIFLFASLIQGGNKELSSI